MFITPSFKKSLIVEQFQGNYLKHLFFFRLLLESLIINTVQYTYITCNSVSQQSTDEKSGSIVAYKDS